MVQSLGKGPSFFFSFFFLLRDPLLVTETTFVCLGFASVRSGSCFDPCVRQALRITEAVVHVFLCSIRLSLPQSLANPARYGKKKRLCVLACVSFWPALDQLYFRRALLIAEMSCVFACVCLGSWSVNFAQEYVAAINMIITIRA